MRVQCAPREHALRPSFAASPPAGNGSNGEAELQKYSWGFGDSEPAHRPGSGTPHTRGLACGAATGRGWEYVEESELGTVVALNVGGKVVPRNDDLVSVCRAEAVWQACLSALLRLPRHKIVLQILLLTIPALHTPVS